MQKIDELRVEYLVIIATKNSFCNSKKSFNNLLSSFDDISIQRNKVKHKNLEVEYELQTEEIEKDTKRFFHLKFTCKNTDKVDEFGDLLRTIKAILYKVGEKQPQQLWDDISKFYSFQLYPIIHDIENLLRKLITKFMLTKIGFGWEKKVIPQEVKSRKKPVNSNYLYEVDFIQLSNFLFSEYETADSKVLIDKIRTLEDIKDLDLDELKDYIPKSNWERYFSPIVDCDNDYLQSRWTKLYRYRCKIAHNNEFNKNDYNETLKLYKEIKEKLKKAIDNLDKIHLSEEDKELIAENIARNTNELYGMFLNEWKVFTSNLYIFLLEHKDYILQSISGTVSTFHINNDFRRYKYNVVMMGRLLHNAQLIKKDDYLQLREVNEMRNILVHETDIIINEHEITECMRLLKKISISILINAKERVNTSVLQNTNSTEEVNINTEK